MARRDEIADMARDITSTRSFHAAKQSGKVTPGDDKGIWRAGYEAGMRRARRAELEPVAGAIEIELRQALRDAAADTD